LPSKAPPIGLATGQGTSRTVPGTSPGLPNEFSARRRVGRSPGWRPCSLWLWWSVVSYLTSSQTLEPISMPVKKRKKWAYGGNANCGGRVRQIYWKSLCNMYICRCRCIYIYVYVYASILQI